MQVSSLAISNTMRCKGYVYNAHLFCLSADPRSRRCDLLVLPLRQPLRALRLPRVHGTLINTHRSFGAHSRCNYPPPRRAPPLRFTGMLLKRCLRVVQVIVTLAVFFGSFIFLMLLMDCLQPKNTDSTIPKNHCWNCNKKGTNVLTEVRISAFSTQSFIYGPFFLRRVVRRARRSTTRS